MPDLAALLRRSAPVLDARLAASVTAGHTDDLWLASYRERAGLRLRFERGRLADALRRDEGARFAAAA